MGVKDLAASILRTVGRNAAKRNGRSRRGAAAGAGAGNATDYSLELVFFEFGNRGFVEGEFLKSFHGQLAFLWKNEKFLVEMEKEKARYAQRVNYSLA
jgi:hypothetical protein